MDAVGLNVIGAINHMIDMVATVVIPFEILLLMVVRRRIFQREVVVNLICAGAIFLCFRVWNLGFGYRVAEVISGYSVLHFRESISSATWVIAHVLIGDLCFYVFHRLAHTKLFFLLDHSLHHSSTELNFTTNLRISVLAPLYSWTPMLVPIFFGFDPVLLFACFGLANAVPFFLHTEHIKKLGWLEYLFNTPSHHRVHHARNACYIDKNFGGILIIWDRLFGTYAEEVEPVTFGVRDWEPSANPLKVVFRGWWELARWLAKDLCQIRHVRSRERRLDIGGSPCAQESCNSRALCPKPSPKPGGHEGLKKGA